MALQQSEKRFQETADALQVGFLLIDRYGVIVQSNPAAEEMLDSLLDGLVGRKITNFGLQVFYENGTTMPFDDRPVLIAFREGVPQYNIIAGVRRATGGEVRWLEVSAVPLGANTPPDNLVVTMIDITRRKQAEDNMRLQL